MRRVRRAAEFAFAVGLLCLVIGAPIALAPVARDWSAAALARGLAVGVGVPVVICTVSLGVGRLAAWWRPDVEPGVAADTAVR